MSEITLELAHRWVPSERAAAGCGRAHVGGLVLLTGTDRVRCTIGFSLGTLAVLPSVPGAIVRPTGPTTGLITPESQLERPTSRGLVTQLRLFVGSGLA